MIWLPTVCVFVFALVFAQRVAAWRRRPVQSSWKSRYKLAKVLIVAALALLAVIMRMRRLSDSLDGKESKPMTPVELILDRY